MGLPEEQAANPGALRGSAMHRVMECLDYGRLEADPLNSVRTQLQELTEQGRISPEAAELVNTYKIGQFLRTELARRIMQAHRQGKLYREQPFVMGIPADEADPGVHSKELVLVQGIIDLYFEEADGLVLLDYKTDAVKTAGQLLDRYQTQMDLYARALAAATGKPVKEKLIYSFKLEEIINA
jgi:ATP-dependent helicase/nuclease subunit A